MEFLFYAIVAFGILTSLFRISKRLSGLKETEQEARDLNRKFKTEMKKLLNDPEGYQPPK